MDLRIGYDREESTKLTPKYFVYSPEENGAVVYKGTYTQCLIVVGTFHLYPNATWEELANSTQGFITDRGIK